jgi:hypothetical protein
MASSLTVHSHPTTSLGVIKLPSPVVRLPFWLPDRIQNGLIAVVMAFLSQLLIAGIQLGLDREGSDFPAPILAMAGVFVCFSISGCIIPGVEGFYRRRLKHAVSGSASPSLPWILAR